MARVAESSVYLVDDDEGILRALTRFLNSEGLTAVAFRSADSFLESHTANLSGCVLVDLRMPRINGLDLQLELKRRGFSNPIIFMSGFTDIPACATAMKTGAVDFLKKPIEELPLLNAIKRAMSIDSERRRRASIAARLARLTVRERQVIDAVSEGLINKQIANRLGVVEKTAKVHRANAMRKIGVRSVAALVRMLLSVSEAPPSEIQTQD